MLSVLLALTVVSCKPEKKNYLFKKMPDKWLGCWVVKSVFDSISAHDTSTTDNCMNLSNNQIFITEFVISKLLSDSVFLNQEDVENWFDILTYISADTLITKNGIQFIYDNSNETIQLNHTKKALKYVFIKATSTMLTDYKITDELSIKTAFRKMFNTEFHKYSYIIADSLRLNDTKKYVTFFADEKVKGLPNFSHYHMNLFGNLNNVENAISLTLQNTNQNESFGLICFTDSIEIYTLLPLTSDTKKTSYKINQKYVTLLKQKWY